MIRFAVATLAPVLLLALAALAGGAWGVLSLLWMTVLAFFLDRIGASAAPQLPESEFPAGRALSVTLGLVQFPLLALCVWTVAGMGDHSPLARAVDFAAFGLFFGQIAMSNAHELIHQQPRALRRLGMGFWRFLPRAWAGSLRKGLAAERARGSRAFRIYALGSIAFLALAALGAGWRGVAALLALAAYAQVQLLLSDYVQHYGLRRVSLPDGRLAPVGPEHSWNAPHRFSSAMMLNAPRHSDHHARPARPFAGLDLRENMPLLPHSLPVMAMIALIPPLWRRMMDGRARKWQTAAAAKT